MKPPVALTIAGSDSGGGAGIQADLKTFHRFSVFGTSAVTAITAQNTVGVHAVHPVPVDVVVRQIEVVAEDLAPAGVKTGMLATAELVSAVSAALDRTGLPRPVVDPVMVASSGDRLLDADAERTIVEELLPRARLVTPNLHEAAILTGIVVKTEDDLLAAARRLVDLGADAALVKGGHLEGDAAIDLLWDGRIARRWSRPRMDSRNTHGTGCTLSAAIAAGLAHGRPLETAVGDAIEFVARAIRTAPDLGAGHGPVNHFADPPGAD